VTLPVKPSFQNAVVIATLVVFAIAPGGWTFGALAAALAAKVANRTITLLIAVKEGNKIDPAVIMQKIEAISKIAQGLIAFSNKGR
jgi:hypothetical protein